jgi:NAD(P)-dependent dehydrogenase (short-subunit alcohol dehydrogenase family)
MKMAKIILITGATDGIGLETAKKFAALGHHLIIHGRNEQKLLSVKAQLMTLPCVFKIDTVTADLSELEQVRHLATTIIKNYPTLDVLINNAGVFKVANPLCSNGLDVRFMVNTVAPYLLTQLLMPSMSKKGLIINLSSAAQAPINIKALLGEVQLEDMQAYAQSKLGIRVWSHAIALTKGAPTCISVNPGSLLATKMVKEGFSIQGHDINIGVNILVKIALDEEIRAHNGEYFDNDEGKFSAQLPLIDLNKMANQLLDAMDSIIKAY